MWSRCGLDGLKETRLKRIVRRDAGTVELKGFITKVRETEIEKPVVG